jgi:EAL domain-containing protein (putative c-di-GMP-specific phosphodiesterase class I)
VNVDRAQLFARRLHDLATSKTDQLIVKSVVDIARGLGKRTIAEFVGDERTLELLREYGIDFAQGFHVGRPRPMEASELHQQPNSPLHSGRGRAASVRPSGRPAAEAHDH